MNTMATGVPIGSQTVLQWFVPTHEVALAGKQTQIADSVWVWYAVSEAFK